MPGSPPSGRGSSGRRPRLAVAVGGRGEPLILIHGLGTTSMIWDPVRPELERSHRVITLDVPGFGRSAPAGPGFDLELVAARIARGLRARGLRDPCDLVGHSLGAGVALTLAAIQPAMVRRLVLVAPAGLHRPLRVPAGLLSPFVEALFASRRRLAGLTDLALGRRLLLAFAAAEGEHVAPTQARLMVEASAGAQRLGEAFAAIAGADLRPLCERTNVPLGLIWGERDRTIPLRVAALISAVRPDASLELIPGAGHVPMVERPARFVTALQTLLHGLPQQTTHSVLAGS